jgi:hypothetical protein
MTQPPATVLQDWLAGRPEGARVAVALDPDRLLCEAGLLGWNTVTDTAGRDWQVVSYRGDELAFRLRFRKAADHARRLVVLTRGEGGTSPIDVSTLADILASNEAGPALDLSLPAYFRRFCPKISFPTQELRRQKAVLLAHLSTVQQAAAKIVERWGRPDDWGRGAVAALAFLARHPDLHLGDLWPDETQPTAFLAHALRTLFSHAEGSSDRSLLTVIIADAAAPQVKEQLFWIDIPADELAGYLVLRRFAAEEGLQNPSTQLAGLGLFGPDVPLDRLEPLAIPVAEALSKDGPVWSAVEGRAECFLTPRRLQKVMALLPAAATEAASLMAPVQRSGVAPVILMHYLRQLVLAFCKNSRAAGLADSVLALERHPLLSGASEPTSPMRDACRAAIQFLVTAGRVEARLTLPVPDFSSPEALLDWYIQNGQHKLELETAQAMHRLDAVGDDAVAQAGHEYLFGAGDDVTPTPASLKGRVRQRLQELDCRLASFVRPDAELFTQRPRSALRLLKEHLGPVVGDLDPDGVRGRVWILLFDGMRYDTWDAVVSPLFAESFRVEVSAPRFAVLPSYTGVARTSLFAGCLPGEWKGFKGGPTKDEGTLLACNLGLTQQDSKAKLRFVPEADTTKARRSLGFRENNAKAVNVLIYPIADDCHEYRGDLAAFNNKIRTEILGDKTQGIRGILDDLLRRVRAEDTVLATADHGFLELLGGDAAPVAEAEVLAAGRDPKDDVHHRYALGFRPRHPEEPVTVPGVPDDHHVAVGRAWWRREGETKSPRYDHGGLSLAEIVVPGALLRRVTEKEVRAELQQLPPVLNVPEDSDVEFTAQVVNCGNVSLNYEVLARSNLGEDLGARQGHLAPGADATHKWSVRGKYGQGGGQEVDRTATLTAVNLRLRHTDLHGQWRDAMEGAQTVPVKVKPKKTKLDTDALRGFDDL